MTSAQQLLAAFADKRILVIGDVMLDRYLSGDSNRIAQEAPVPVVDVSQTRECAGGAANVAANLRGLGAKVSLIGAIGDDADGHTVRGLLAQDGINVRAVPAPRTVSKTRICSREQVLLRFDEGRPAQLDPVAIDGIVAAIVAEWPLADAVIISDYNYGVIADTVLACIAACQQKSPRPLAVDARDLRRTSILRPTVVKPDYKQAWAMVGNGTTPSSRLIAIEQRVDDLLAATGAQTVCVTLDCDGSLVCERGGSRYRIPAARGGVAHPNGAGDTYLAAFTLAHLCGAPVDVAGNVAAAAAAVAVRTPGTAVCTLAQLAGELQLKATPVVSTNGLEGLVSSARQDGKRIVFTNGVFDVIHSGHVTYLQEAAKLGDLLIVGINDDESVHRLKGPQRPLNPIQERMAVIAGLAAVAAVVPFSEDTPERLIRQVRPDVYVKGGDYHRSQLREAALVESLGGEVVIAGYVPGRSTTELIARAKSGSQPRRKHFPRGVAW